MNKSELKHYIAKRAALELKDGDVVNLGIGMPTLVPEYLPEGVTVTLQAENGLIGCGPVTEENRDPHYVYDAGANPAALTADGCFTDSISSFGLMRGGHLDVTILGSLEVDETGSLSNWIIPGQRVFGMGGAMDLVVGAKKVIVVMEHTNHGQPKILKRCTLPYTAVHCVDMVITEMGVMEICEDGIVLKEYNPVYTIEEIQHATQAQLILAEDLKPYAT
ncbi:MAG: 3-oxoacid CoA-transferase subunit B [Parasporobacterium sp.]|nr:3-oxoacid CoA-transferase subunit B [Parasporobacterium sp.]